MTYTFKTCGAGVVVRYPGDTKHQHLVHWWRIRDWCEKQGWKLSEDYLVPGKVPDGKWYFKTKEQRMWFTLRWS